MKPGSFSSSAPFAFIRKFTPRPQSLMEDNDWDLNPIVLLLICLRRTSIIDFESRLLATATEEVRPYY